MNFEARLMVLSQKVDSKLHKMASELKNFDESKMATEIIQIFDFFFEMSFDTPAFKVVVFVSDLEFWIELNGLVDIPTQILLTIMGSTNNSSRCNLVFT